MQASPGFGAAGVSEIRAYHKGSFKGLHKGVEIPKIRGTLFWDPYYKDPTI